MRYNVALIVLEGCTGTPTAEGVVRLHLLQLLFLLADSLLSLQLLQVFRVHRGELVLIIIL